MPKKQISKNDYEIRKTLGYDVSQYEVLDLERRELRAWVRNSIGIFSVVFVQWIVGVVVFWWIERPVPSFFDFEGTFIMIFVYGGGGVVVMWLLGAFVYFFILVVL